jgi:hypothetical protein
MSLDDHISPGLVLDELVDFSRNLLLLAANVSSATDDMLNTFGRRVDRQIVDPADDADAPPVSPELYWELHAVLSKAWGTLDRALVEILDLRDSQDGEGGAA